MLRAWLELARISNLPTVWTNVSAGWLLAGGGWDARLGWLLLAGSLLYTGGMILNDAADVKFDREHRPERAIPSERVSAAAAWTAGIFMLVLGAWLGFAHGCAHPLLVAGLVLAILFYDLYHKPWAGSVVVMGACRTLLICMAGSARLADEAVESGFLIAPAFRLGLEVLEFMPGLVLLHACAVGIYTVALSMAARSGGKSPATWLLWTPLCVLLAAMPVEVGPDSAGPLALFVVPAAFVMLVISARLRLRRGRVDAAVGMLLAGFVIADALAVCPAQPLLGLAFTALAPLLRLWQRWIAAT